MSDARPPCPFDAALVLGADPFAGDFGDGERVLRDAVGRVRKPFACHTCAEEGRPGDWARIRAEAGPDGVATYRWCAACCLADTLGDEDALGDRELLGSAIRGGAPAEEIAALRAAAGASLAAAANQT